MKKNLYIILVIILEQMIMINYSNTNMNNNNNNGNISNRQSTFFTPQHLTRIPENINS